MNQTCGGSPGPYSRRVCTREPGHTGRHWSEDGASWEEACTATVLSPSAFSSDGPTRCALPNGHDGPHLRSLTCPKATILQHGHVRCGLENGHTGQHYSMKVDHHWGEGESSRWRIVPVPSWEGCLWQIYDPLGVLRDVKATLGEAMDALHP